MFRFVRKIVLRRLMVPVFFAAVILAAFLMGKVPIGLGTYVALPFIGLGLALYGFLRGLWAATNWKMEGVISGILLFFVGLYLFFSALALTKDTGFQTLVREKFPVVGICSVPTPNLNGAESLWNEHKPDPSGAQRFVNEHRPEIGVDIPLPGR